MMKNHALNTLVFGGLLAAVIMLWMQHAELVEMVSKSQAQLERLERLVMRSETQPQVAKSERVDNASDRRATSPSELHKPKGPMPKSILVKSEPQEGEPERGVDLTSGIRRRALDPCEAPCRRLADCALDRQQCPAMDTRNQSDVLELCIDACSRSESIAKSIIGGTECAPAIRFAREKIDRFKTLCNAN